MFGELLDQIFTSCCGNNDTVCTGKYTVATPDPTPVPTPAPTPPSVDIAEVCAEPERYDDGAYPGTIPSMLINDLWTTPPSCTGGPQCSAVHGDELSDGTACNGVGGCTYEAGTEWTMGSCGELGDAYIYIGPHDGAAGDGSGTGMGNRMRRLLEDTMGGDGGGGYGSGMGSGESHGMHGHNASGIYEPFAKFIAGWVLYGDSADQVCGT